MSDVGLRTLAIALWRPGVPPGWTGETPVLYHD
jgi:hypothetical protein